MKKKVVTKKRAAPKRKTVAMAEREIELVLADGKLVTVVLALGCPAQQPGGEWACEVSARGLYERLAPQRGIDALQALVLAITLLRTLIAAEIERGATAKWVGDQATLSELFGAAG